MNSSSKLIKDLSQLIVPLIVIAFILLSEKLGLSSEKTQIYIVQAAAAAAFFLILYLFDYLDRIFFSKKDNYNNYFEELQKDLGRYKKKSILVVRNTEIPDLSSTFSDAIYAGDWWDWNFIGNHPDCGLNCGRMVQELKDIYLDSPDSEKNRASTLCYLKEYPFKDDSFIFMGDVVVPSENVTEKNFPQNLFHAESKNGIEPDFTKLYIIKTGWNANSDKCGIEKIDLVRDPQKIEKKWRYIKNKIKMQFNDASYLLFTDNAPDKKERQNFFKSIEGVTCQKCESEIFIVSTHSGSLKDIRKRVGSAGWVVAIGWILSPIYFNYTIIKVFLCLLFTYLIAKFSGFDFSILIILVYFFLNFLGIYLISCGLKLSGKKTIWRLSPIKYFLPILYSIIIFLITKNFT